MQLTLKYRPTTWEDMVGQEPAKVVLKAACSSSERPSAYVLAGPRGSGKTTAARIFAHALVDFATSVDLVEVDAATRNGIDDIRELIDLTQFAAPSGHRTIILDEAHALSSPAWQALLKTLEEPSASTTWLLVTTEPERIPDTVASRCIPLNFSTISAADIAQRLRHIADLEGLSVDHDVLDEVSREADGSLRDAVMALDQLTLAAGGTHITLTTWRELFGVPNYAPAFLDACSASDLTRAASILETYAQHAPDPRRLVDDCILTLADLIPVTRSAHTRYRYVEAIAALWELRQALTATPLGTRAALAVTLAAVATNLADIPIADTTAPTTPNPTTPHEVAAALGLTKEQP